MNDSRKTKAQLIEELQALRARTGEPEPEFDKGRRHNHLLRAFIDLLPDGGIYFDLEGRLLNVVKGRSSPFAEAAEPLQGRYLAEVVPAEDSELLLGALRRTVETGEQQSIEFVPSILRRRRWFEVRTSLPADGSPDTVVCVFRDITDIKLTEGVLELANVELREQSRLAQGKEELFRRVLTSAPLVIWALDSEGVFTLSEGHGLDGLGLTPGQVVGRSVFDIYAENAQVLDDARRALQGEQVTSVLEEKGHYYDCSYSPLLDEDGQVTGAVGIAIEITDRVRAENEARASRHLLETVFDTIPFNVVVKDTESRYLMVNRTWLRNYGLDAAEVLGRHVLEIEGRPEEDRRNAVETDERVYAGAGEEMVVDQNRTTKTGEERRFQSHYSRLHDAAGNTIGLVSVDVDVTDARRTEDELRTSRRLLETVFDTIPFNVVVKDTESRYLMVNRAWLRNYGLDASEVLGKHTLEIQARPEQERRDAVVSDRKALTGAAAQMVLEKTRTTNSGEERRLLSHYSQLRDAAGNTIGLVVIDVDVTAARTAEEELRASQRLLSTIFENIPLGVCLKDQEGRYLMVNKSFADYVNRTPEEMVGKVSRDIGYGAELEQRRVEESDRHVFEKGLPWETPVETFTFPNGEIHLRRVLKVPLKDEAGAVVGLLGIREDITERRRIEEQLRHSQKMEAIGTLAGGIAHDLNNILSPIIGYCELLIESAAIVKEERGFVETILRSANRAKDLVSQILLFSRRTKSEQVVFDLRPLCKDVMKLIRSTVPSNILILESYGEAPAPIEGDPSQIHQVLMNLCINARQAMPEGGTLTVSAGTVQLMGVKSFFGRELAGEYVRVEVSDTGEGMDEATLSHMFDPFFTTKDVGIGTGLGLATVFGIIQAHDGDLVVNSTREQGTSLEVYLPVAQDAELMLEPQGPLPAEEGPAATGTETILMIDDEPSVLEVTQKMLERLGYQVTAVSDCLRGLALFEDHPERFDLVITDQTMPGATGDRVVAALRTVRPDVPVVLCTGFSETMNPERAKALGVNHFLYKPVQPRDLARVVRDVLDHRR